MLFYHSLTPPLILLASFISLGMIVTRFAWIAHNSTSSNNITRNASEASCKAIRAAFWNLRSLIGDTSWTISLISLEKGSAGINRLVDFWYFLISFNALVPGLCRGVLLPEIEVLSLSAKGRLPSLLFLPRPPVDFLAICFWFPNPPVDGRLNWSFPSSSSLPDDSGSGGPFLVDFRAIPWPCSKMKTGIYRLLHLGKPSKKNRIFHDIVQNSFDTYPPYLTMT